MTGPRDKARLTAMHALYMAGNGLEEIGAMFGVTGAAVSYQLRTHACDTKGGGRFKKTSDRRKASHDKKAAEIFNRTGLSYDEYQVIASAKGVKAYTHQRKSAAYRGVPWEFTLGTWWAVWTASGRWLDRGCTAGKFVMGRFGDIGPYSPSNVEIITHVQNSLDCRMNSVRAKK